jgi:hypothetical protein
MLATRESILGKNDLRIEKCIVPEWDNAEVYVKSITGAERDRFEASLVQDKTVTVKKTGRKKTIRATSLERIRARLLVIAICQGPDNPLPLFSEDDIEMLAEKSASALDPLFEIAQRLSGFSQEEIETLAGN